MKVFYQQRDVQRDDAVIVLVYGHGWGWASPKVTEFLAQQIANAAGCFPTLRASFKDGVVYNYAKGRVLNFNDLSKPWVIADITSKIYNLNHIDVESLTLLDRDGEPTKYDGKRNVLSRIEVLFKQIKQIKKIEDEDRNNSFQNFRQKFTNEMLLEEYEFIQQVYDEVQMPVVFAHGDLQPHNMVIDDESNEVMFVDFDSTGYSYGCWDLSHLLSMKSYYDVVGWTDESEPDTSEATRMMYIKCYLVAMFKSLGKDTEQISDVDIEFMELQFKLVELSVHFHFLLTYLALATVPWADALRMIPPTSEKYTTLKSSINDIKVRYLELKTALPCLDSCKTGRLVSWF